MFSIRSIRPKIICTYFTSKSSDKPSEICSRSQKSPGDSYSFIISIDKHAYTTIHNISNHFIVVITPVKGKMVKVFGVMVQVKGEGTFIWKIEDGDGIIHPIKTKKTIYVPEVT